MPRTLLLSLCTILLWSCAKNKEIPIATPKNQCGCTLTDEEMITMLPIRAAGDSIVVCKVGTNNVIGSGRGPMTWLDYLQSEYNGGEGVIYDCTINKPFEQLYPSRILKYRNKSLVVDYRFPIDVYDAYNKTWIDVELPTYRQTIYAKNNQIIYSKPELIFEPPRQRKMSFAAADEAYQKEIQRTDHYMISGVVKKLFTAAVNGDDVSKTRFENITTEFAAYYKEHDDSYAIYRQYRKLYNDYNRYLTQGGKAVYYDLTVFPYFKTLKDSGKSYE